MHYDPTTIKLHWLTAILVAALWLIGQTADFIPKGALQNASWSIHIILGGLLTFVLIWRLLWRASGGHQLPPANEGLLQTFTKLAHYMLYSLLLLVTALGLMNAFIRGFNLFGIAKLPQLGSPDWKRPISELHELGANVLMLVALLHSAIALGHHFIKHDDILRRMIFRSSPK